MGKLFLCLIASLSLISELGAMTWYVDAAVGNDANVGSVQASPFKSIQKAIDVAASNDVVCVNDGVYDPIVSDNKCIRIVSVNGPGKTIIDGGGTNRCATLAFGRVGEKDQWEFMDWCGILRSTGNDTRLEGFCLRNGYSERTAAFDELDLLMGGAGGGVAGGTLDNCVIEYCLAEEGAGARLSNLNRCIVRNCICFGQEGGGAFGGKLVDCLITGNDAGDGGGASNAELVSCTVVDNSISGVIGGMSNAWYGGGQAGVVFCSLQNCIVCWNYAVGLDPRAPTSYGGPCIDVLSDVERTTARYNDDGTIDVVANGWTGDDGVARDSCIYPYVFWGKTVNCIQDDPCFYDREHGDYRLLPFSPSIDRGANVEGLPDLDVGGRTRVVNGRVDIGAYEWQEDETDVWITVTFDLGTCGTYAGGGALVQKIRYGEMLAVPEFATLKGFRFFGWDSDLVHFTATNVTVKALWSREWHVDANGGSDVNDGSEEKPFASIQKAIDASSIRDVIYVNDGVYDPIVSSNKCIRIVSVNGPEKTIIDGFGGDWEHGRDVRCATLSRMDWRPYDDGDDEHATVLEGFSLVGGEVEEGGAGVLGGTLVNCAIEDCYAQVNGGGACGASMTNCIVRKCGSYLGSGTFYCDCTSCLIVDNSAGPGAGAAAYGGMLVNCTIANNTYSQMARKGEWMNSVAQGYDPGSAGLDWCDAVNCIVCSNVVCCIYYPEDDSWAADVDLQSTTRNCWIGKDPNFFDGPHGDYRLLPFSPCINKGADVAALPNLDVGGRPRIVNGCVDLGAYEWQMSETVGVSTVTFDLGEHCHRIGGGGLVQTVTNTLSATAPFVQADSGWLHVGWDRPLTRIVEDTIIQAVCRKIADGTVVLSGEISEDRVLSSAKTYIINGQVEIAPGVTVTISPQTVVKFMSGSSLVVAVGGYCLAEGVTFTHVNDDTIGGDTLFDGDASKPVQDRYFVDDNVRSDETTEFRYLTPKAVTLSGTLSKNETWKGYKVYRVTGNLTIPSGVTLTVEPGAIIKFDAGRSLTVASGGTLNVEGTRAQPIVFTSIKDDEFGGDTNGDGDKTKAEAGDWARIYAGGTVNMTFCRVANCNNNGDNGAIQGTGGKVTLNNCLLERSAYELVRMNSGSFAAYNCIFREASMGFGWYGGSGTKCYNCVIADVSEGVRSSNKYFYNCIFYRVLNFGSAGNSYNCCFYNPPDYVNSAQSFSGVGRNGNIWADPLFVNPDNGDFRIAEDSPCVDAGDETAAPKTDWYGQPRTTFPLAQQTGKPDANGNYVDIGIYEVQPRNVKSDIDLSIVSVATESSATVGETLKVSWTVENLGSATATDSWRDTFELIDASGATVKLGSHVVSDGLVAGGRRVFTANFRVPAVASGAARLRVKVNPERDIFEGVATENNVAYADGTIDIALASYTSGDYSTVSVGAGSSTALTIPPDSGITALIIRGGAGLSAYGAYGYVPKALRNDITAVRLEDGSLLLTLPTTAGTDDFTFVIANDGVWLETVSIEPAVESLEIVEATPNRLSNAGDGYVTISGVALDKIVKLSLVGKTNHMATRLNAVSPAELTAVFALADATPGTYALVAEDAGGMICRLEGAVEIFQPKGGAKLEAHLDVPSSARRGRIYTGRIIYSNVGDTDMYAPWLQVKMPGATIMLDGEEFDGANYEVVGISPSFPSGILKAGEANVLTFEFKCNSTIGFSLSSEEYRPDDEEMSRRIADVASRVNSRGRQVCLLGDLLRYLEAIEANPARYAVSGMLLEAVDGSPLSGVEIGVYDSAGNCVAVDTVDDGGRFVLDGLDAGVEYTAEALAPDLQGSFSIPVGSGQDINGLVWTATRGFPVVCSFSHLNETWDRVCLRVIPLSGGNPEAPADVELKLSSDCRGETRLPAAGIYLIVARDGTGLEAASVVEVSSFDLPTTVDFDFSSGSKVAGRVCDQDGVPIVSADVVVKNVQNGTSVAALTDENGNYRAGVLPAGDYEIIAAASGFGHQVAKIVQVNGIDDCLGIDFGLVAMRNELNGLVAFGDVKGWYVEFTDSAHSLSRFQLVDANGRFSLKGLPNCKGVLRVYDDRGVLRWVDQNISIVDSVTAVTVEADQMCYVVCRACSEDGKPIRSTWAWTSGNGDEQIAGSGDNGESIVAIPRGEYRVVICAEGYVDGLVYMNVEESKRVSVTLRRAGYCRFILPEGMRPEAVELVAFNKSGLHYGGSSSGNAYMVSSALEPGEAQLFAVQGNRAVYSEHSDVKGGITNDVGKIDGKELEIDLSEKDWSRVSTIDIIHRDGSGIVLSREVGFRFLRFSEYPDIALKVEARGAHNEVLASVERASGSVGAVRLFPSATVNIVGALEGATQGQLLGATVSFTSSDGHKLRDVCLTDNGRFSAVSVPELFANLWFSLSDGTAFPVPRQEAALNGYVCKVPATLGKRVLKIRDDRGSAIVGMPFVVTDSDGNSTVQTTDSKGQLTIRRKSGEQTVTPCDKMSQVEAVAVEVPKFVCSICRKDPCECLSGVEGTVCEKCEQDPCVCESQEIQVKDSNEGDEERIPQYELPEIRVKYGETLADDIDLHTWNYWNPSECWATDIELGLSRYIDEYVKIHKSPPPYVAACEERKCTYNQRVYKRYRKADSDFSDEYDRISAALEYALARSRQCRRLLRNSSAGELAGAYTSYMIGGRIQAPVGASRGEQIYLAGTRSVISSGPAGYAGYVNAREEGMLDPNGEMNREGATSIAWNAGGEIGDAVIEHSGSAWGRAAGGALSVGCGPVVSTVSVWRDHTGYINEMNNRISSIAAMFASLDAKLQYLIGAANTPYHECMRTYSPYETPYAMYITPLETYTMPTVMSCDPNEMAGPAGVGEKRYVKPGAWMDYTVYFENMSDATAAAQEIRVTLPKDPGLDWSTLELGEVAFGDNIDSWFAGKASGENTYAPSGSDTQVKTVVTVTDETVEWHLRSWDPNTPDHFPANVADGFLPPNDPDTHCGEGHVRFRVKVKDAAAIGSKINALATIVFDANPPITTDPAWWNTVGQVRKIVVSNDGVESEIEVFEGAVFGELPDPGTPPENCVFDGWYTKPGGNGRRINALTTVEAEIEAIYAHWLPYVAEMDGVKYTRMADAVKKCPYNAGETSEIKLLSDFEYVDGRTYEYVDEDEDWPAKLEELRANGRWASERAVLYRHKLYLLEYNKGHTMCMSSRDSDWAFFTGQKVAVDLNGHLSSNVWLQVDCAEAAIRDASEMRTGAVELTTAVDLSYGVLTLESGKLIEGPGYHDRATVLVCDDAGRFDFLGGEIVTRDGVPAVYVSNGCIRVGSDAVATNAGCNVVLDLDASLVLVSPLTGRIGITTDNDVEGSAIGLNPSGFAGAENLYCDSDPSLRGRTTDDGAIVWERVGQFEESVGRYVNLDLVDELGIVIPTNVNYAAGDKVTVKVEGLPKGLKVVATPVYANPEAKKKVIKDYAYTIEGVPTEAVDFNVRPMYARVTVTYKDKTMGVKGKVESLQPIELSIVTPKPSVLTAGVLNQAYGPFDIAELWPDVAGAKDNPKEWSFKGWPTGIKYTTKDVTKKNKDKSVTTNAVAYSVYGTPTKAGVFPITATRKHKLADGKTTVSETFSAVLTVWGDDGVTDFRYTDQAYVATETKTLDATWKSFSGLPTGIKYTTKLIAADMKKGTPEYPACSLYGTPTKAGVFAVTATKVDPADPAGKKTVKETFLWKVAPAAAPTFALDTGTAPVEDLKAQIVQGANQSFAVTASEGAKVSVSGLPSGLKLVQDKETKLYAVEGVATKPGEYRVTFKTVLNGVTTQSVVAFTVKDNPFVATYCGYLTARPADGAENRLAIAEVTVAAAGMVKLTYTEGKTKYTASVKSFDWNDADGRGKAEGLVLKVSSADKKLGYGDRKVAVTLNDCGAYRVAKVTKITDANGVQLSSWTADLYETVKTTEVPLPASQTFVFRTEDGADTNALATVSVAYDAKKATAAFSGKLYDGTAVKATVPVTRCDDEGGAANYVFVPFLVTAKDGETYLFDCFGEYEEGGYVDWVTEDGEDTECAYAVNVDYTLGDKKFAELVPEAGTFTFGWGSDTAIVGAPTESFTFEVTTDKNGNPSGVAIYDAEPQEGEKPLAMVTAKMGKTTGAISVSFTSKKDDKAKYAVELVWRGDKLFAGHVTRTWKGLVDGKPVNLTAYGTAEVK